MMSAELYGDIMGLGRPVHDGDLFSRTHPKMARGNRAKLFASFAALSGFEACVRARELPFEPKRILSAWEKRRLDQVLRALYGRKGSAAEAVCFEICEDGCGAPRGYGLYRRLRGTVQRVDPVARTLRIDDAVIAFDDIYRLRLLSC